MPDARRLRRDAGQSLVECALLLMLISLVAVSVMGTVGDEVGDVFDRVSTALSPVAAGDGTGGGGGGNGHGAGGNGQGNNGNGNGNGGPSGASPGNGGGPGGGGGRP